LKNDIKEGKLDHFIYEYYYSVDYFGMSFLEENYPTTRMDSSHGVDDLQSVIKVYSKCNCNKLCCSFLCVSFVFSLCNKLFKTSFFFS